MNIIRKLYLRRRTAYSDLFKPNGEYTQSSTTVLADLRKFCFGSGSAFSSDPYEHARNEGRREVFERIRSYTNVTDDEIYRLTENLENGYE